MKKREFFLEAMKAEEYKRSAWVISAFSLIRENENDWKSNPFAYRIVQTPGGFFYINPQDTTSLLPIEDSPIGQALFSMKEMVSLEAGVLPNQPEPVITNYGTILANYICLVYPFGDKIPFVNERFSASKLEQMVVERMKAVAPADPAERDPELIYVDEYLKFTNAMMSLTAYTQLCVPASTEKTITPPPGIQEYRAKLLEENKHHLHDPAVIAKIDAQLVQYLKDWLKDDPGMGFLISNKSFDVVRKELYLMIGANVGMDGSGKFELVKGSLSEGWNPENFDILNTVSRSGSFSRGAETEKGGEATKWLFRAASNMSVTGEDCGSTVGVEIFAKPGEERKLIGFTAILGDKQVKITKDNVGQYLGRALTLRSSAFCRFPKTDFCKVCVGDRLANSPTGLATAIAAYGSTFMSLMMSAMHGTALKTTRLDWKKEIG